MGTVVFSGKLDVIQEGGGGLGEVTERERERERDTLLTTIAAIG